MKNYKLQNGVEIPEIGFGTYLIDPKDTTRCVLDALQVGYRHIDTAQAYGNEHEVGIAVKACGLKREEIFITSKVAAEIKDYATAKASIEESLKKLDVEYIDLMLIHCPEPWWCFRGPNHYFKENKEVWRALEEAYLEKKIRAIGVSNFLKEDIDNILEDCKIQPMVNQFQINPEVTDLNLINYCKEKGIVVEAYSPIMHGRALNYPMLQTYANQYQVSVAQLCIEYCRELGVVVLPKASTKEHMEQNLKLDFTITEKDRKALMNMK